MVDEAKSKCKTRRRSLVGWINDKLKEKHQKAMEKSMKKEEELGHKLVLLSKSDFPVECYGVYM